MQRSYESNGPDVKVRGTAQHVAEKYLQLARDAQSSGDPVAAENYFQHAEHYYRILLAAQEQMAQQFGHSFPPNRAFSDDPDEGEEEGEEEAGAFQAGGQPQPERQQFNGNNGGVNGHAGQRQDGEGGEGQPGGGQRFERPNRNQDRNFDRNQDRNGQRRFDRNDRPERNDRQERGERRFERQDGQPAPHAPRPEAQAGAEQPDFAPAPSQAERRPERQPRAERQPRRTEVPAVAPDQETAAALPAFLTMPTRVPIAIASDEPDATAPAVESAAVDAAETSETEKPKRARGRRRSPREVMDALGSDSDTAAE